MRGELRAAVVWLMVAAAWPSLPVMLAPLLLTPTEAVAQARRSSGGYSRPGGSLARTPSFGGGSRVAPRTPSFGSGGYSRPGASYGRAPSFGTQSLGDRSYSRTQSGNALGQLRAQQDAARRQQQAQQAQQQNRTPDGRFAPGFSGGAGVGAGAGLLGGLFGGGQRNVRPNWYSNQGWAAPTTRPSWRAQA